MKADPFILQQLLNRKNVTLRGIGSFSLDASMSAQEPETPGQIPEGAIRFTYDPKAPHDESLILLLMQQTGKIRPLALGDLESYLDLALQFLNLGKPFLIEGLGTLQKDASGHVGFFQGAVSSAITETPVNDQVRERSAPDISFASQPKKKKLLTKKRLTAIGIAVVLIALLIYLFSGGNENDKKSGEASSVRADSAVKKDTAPPSPPQIRQTSEIPDTLNAGIPDSTVTFRVVLKQFNSLPRAYRFYNNLKQDHDLSVYTSDSITYKVAVNIKAPLGDTARVSDSLYDVLGIPVYYEIMAN